MSRYNKFLKRGSTEAVAYGFDKATGYFFQVFGEDVDGEENLVVDECSTFTGMSRSRMIELMEEYGVGEEHKHLVALDLPI